MIQTDPRFFHKSISYFPIIELLSINKEKLPKCFSQREAIRDLLKPLNFSCCLCKISNTNGRSRRFGSTFALQKHVTQVHHNFIDPASGLTESKVQDLIDLLDLILYLRMIN